MPWPFSKPKETDLLNKQQKQVLGSFKKIEKQVHGEFKEAAIERIIEEYLTPLLGNSLSEREMQRRADMLYQACKVTLRNAPLTTNVSAGLFINEGFYNSDELKTVWTTKTGKNFDYFNTRQSVEQNVFGYKVDWSVPVSVAARTRPIYAGLNYTSHPYGAAVAYGSINLTLKGHVRDRCTFIRADTFTSDFNFSRGNDQQVEESKQLITTVARIGNLLKSMSKSQLKALCQVSGSKYTIDDFPPNYIEAHIHGPVTWARDLDSIKIATSGQNTLEKECQTAKRQPGTIKYLVTEWAKRYNVRASVFRLDEEIEVLYAG